MTRPENTERRFRESYVVDRAAAGGSGMTEFRPATRYGRDEPARRSQWRGVLRDALIGSLVLFAFLIVASGVPT